MNKIHFKIGIIILGIAIPLTTFALVPLPGNQGGTGLNSATAGQVGTCLKVTDDSPFTYVLGTCGGASVGSATSTEPLMASWFVATSTTATSTFGGNATVVGNVGIGTPSPAQKLDVVGNIKSAPTASTGRYYFGANLANIDFDNGTGNFVINNGSGGGYSFQLVQNASTPFVVSTSNNVGIGSTTPWGKLSVTNTGTAPSFVVEDAASPDSSPFIVDATGKVGIGTTTPSNALTIANSGKLDFVGPTYTTTLDGSGAALIISSNYPNTTSSFRLLPFGDDIYFQNTLSSGNMNFTGVGGGNLTGNFNFVGTGIMNFGATGSERLKILANGNVGIGNTSPNSKLDVNGSVNISSGNIYMINETKVVSASTTLSNYFFGPSGNLTMTGTSNFGIGSGVLLSNTSGTGNSAMGTNSLLNNTLGTSNKAFGLNALFNNTVGNENVAFGDYSLFSNVSGSNNAAMGSGVFASSLGSGNVGLGYYAGAFETGSNSFYVDNQNRGSTAGDKAGALLYGTFSATPANQTLTINASVGIGTTSPFAKLSVQSLSGTAPLFAVATSTSGAGTTTPFMIDQNGEIKAGGGTPTISACGAAPDGTVVGNDTTGTVTIGGGVPTACTVTFNVPKRGTPHVFIQVQGATAIGSTISAKSSTAFTATFGAALGGGTFSYWTVSD